MLIKATYVGTRQQANPVFLLLWVLESCKSKGEKTTVLLTAVSVTCIKTKTKKRNPVATLNINTILKELGPNT